MLLQFLHYVGPFLTTLHGANALGWTRDVGVCGVSSDRKSAPLDFVVSVMIVLVYVVPVLHNSSRRPLEHFSLLRLPPISEF